MCPDNLEVSKIKIKTMAIQKELIFTLLLFCGCVDNNSNKGNLNDSNKGYSLDLAGQKQLPFVGKRLFETRPGVSGTGTPYRQIEIKNDGAVEFLFEQENQADKTITKGFYNAGKFTNVIKCVFEDWDNEVRFYKIMPDKIYEVDSNGNVLKLDECCSELEMRNCPCESEYISL